MSDDDVLTLNVEGENISDYAHTEARCDARGEIAPLRRCAEHGGAIPAGLDAFGGCRSGRFRVVVSESGVLDDDHDIRTVLPELLRFRRYSRWPEQQCMHLSTAGFVGEHARGCYRFESHLPHFAAARLDKCKHVCHQRTLASVCRSFTSSGTAAAPSPMMRPAWRSGGSSRRVTVSCGCGSCAGFDSSGFFLAAMIPLSDGSRAVLSPSSTVSTAGSGNSTISCAPSSSRLAVPFPLAISSEEIALTHGSWSISATIWPTTPFDESGDIFPNRIRS